MIHERRHSYVDPLAKMVINYLGFFLILSFTSGIVLLVFRPSTPESLVTTLIVSPISVVIGNLAGLLANPNRVPSNQELLNAKASGAAEAKEQDGH
jgi:hypothetical protein